MNSRRTHWKPTLAAFALLALAQPAFAQSSQDHWDAFFNPRAVQKRQEQRYQKWLNSWKDRECTAEDVKRGWYIQLVQIVPDRLNSQYYKVLDYNKSLASALEGIAYDFEAQDLADEININRFKRKGMTVEAEALEQTRLARIRLHQQEQFQKQVRARLNAMQQQIDIEVAQLRAEVASARADAAAARSEAQQAEAQSRP